MRTHISLVVLLFTNALPASPADFVDNFTTEIGSFGGGSIPASYRTLRGRDFSRRFPHALRHHRPGEAVPRESHGPHGASPFRLGSQICTMTSRASTMHARVRFGFDEK